jgi:hypothetical protein
LVQNNYNEYLSAIAMRLLANAIMTEIHKALEWFIGQVDKHELVNDLHIQN